jgi:hypothetical protein
VLTRCPPTLEIDLRTGRRHTSHNPRHDERCGPDAVRDLHNLRGLRVPAVVAFVLIDLRGLRTIRNRAAR